MLSRVWDVKRGITRGSLLAEKSSDSHRKADNLRRNCENSTYYAESEQLADNIWRRDGIGLKDEIVCKRGSLNGVTREPIT